MAGGEGSPRRRTGKSVEVAATGPPAPAPLRTCSSSTKRKAAGKEAASGRRMPRPRALRKKETTSASAVVSACADADTEKAATRLPAKDIRWILAQVPESPPHRFQALKRSNPELVPRPGEEEDEKLMAMYGVTRALYEVKERLPKLQQWVRSELREKGFVEVGHEWFKRTAESRALSEREWPSIRAKLDELSLMDGPGLDDSESDSDDDEEDGEDDDDLDSVMKDYM